MTKDNNFLAYLYLFLTVTFWAGNFVVGKLASFYEVPPFSLNFYRWFFAWLILAPFTLPEILNKKDALIINEKIRPKPTKPELLPLEVEPIEKKILKSVDKNSLKDTKISNEKISKTKAVSRISSFC